MSSNPRRGSRRLTLLMAWLAAASGFSSCLNVAMPCTIGAPQRLITGTSSTLSRVPCVGLAPSRGGLCRPPVSRSRVARASIAGRARRRHLFCSYGALISLIAVKAVVVQALPALLTELSMRPDRVAEDLSTIAAASAALEFALLPAVAALSDAYGRRPMLIGLPLIVVAMRCLVIGRPAVWTLVLSRAVVGALVQFYDLFVGISAADIYEDDPESFAALEGKTAAAWGAMMAVGIVVGGAVLSAPATALLSGARRCEPPEEC